MTLLVSLSINRHSNGEELLMYKDAHYQDNTLSSMFRRVKPISSSGTGDLHPGQLYNWQAANVYNDRDYAIEVIYDTCKFCWSVVTSVLYYRRSSSYI